MFCAYTFISTRVRLKSYSQYGILVDQLNDAFNENCLATVYIWNSVQLNHPYGTFSKFPEQAKEK